VSHAAMCHSAFAMTLIVAGPARPAAPDPSKAGT
jgi:hypothetical protein